MILSDCSIREGIARGRLIIDPLDDSCIQPSSVGPRLGLLIDEQTEPTASRGYHDFEQDPD